MSSSCQKRQILYRSPYELLERGTGSASNVDFSIKDRHSDERPSEVICERRERRHALGTSERPQHVRCRISHARAHRMGSLPDVEEQRLAATTISAIMMASGLMSYLAHPVDDLAQAAISDEASAREFCAGEGCTVPG